MSEKNERLDLYDVLAKELGHLARLALAGREQDIEMYVRRLARRHRETLPTLADSLRELLRERPTRASPLRKTFIDEIPVDIESRLKLIRAEEVRELPVEPVWRRSVGESLQGIVDQRRSRDRLEERGLEPTRSALFTGPPGIGKTLAARWIARELEVPLLALDLSAVMSSYLGRTGNNLHHVLEYAKRSDCLLLLDELDAIAKRRDDQGEIGELKRLVTVLLQEIDDWPSTSLLIAATNHEDLLDPAVWRRFDVCVQFPMPSGAEVKQAVTRYFGPDLAAAERWLDALAMCLEGESYSDIERTVVRVRRDTAVSGRELGDALSELIRERVERLPRSYRRELATRLVETGALSQRQASQLSGVSRDTIRKAIGDSGQGNEGSG